MTRIQDAINSSEKEIEKLIGVANRDIQNILDELDSDVTAEFALLYEYAEPEDDE